MKRFVLVVDTQWDFMAEEGALSVAGAQPLVPPMRAWLAALEPADVAGVLFTFDTHIPDVYAASPEAQAFPLHCVKGSAGWMNMLSVSDVDDAIPVWRLEKGVFDMWEEDAITLADARDPAGEQVEREGFFRALAQSGVQDVTVIGVAADYCVRWAVAGLLSRGFHVTVPADLTRGIARSIDTVAQQDFAGEALTVSA